MNGFGNYSFPTGDGGVLVHEPRTEILQNFVCRENNSNCGRNCTDSNALLVLILLLLSGYGNPCGSAPGSTLTSDGNPRGKTDGKV